MREELHFTMHDTSKCWYRNNCPNVDTESCKWSCQRMQQTKYLFDLSNLRPPHRKSQNLNIQLLNSEAQTYINGVLGDVPYFVRNGFNAYFYGGTGNGKTSWAVEILTNYFFEIAETNCNECRGLFISVPTLLMKTKMNIAHPNFDPYFCEIVDSIGKVDLVIWDDIIQTDPTAYESQLLYSLINERLLRKRANIFTSNLSRNELSEVDYRLYSRICTMSDCVEFTGEDMRVDNKFSAVVEQYMRDNPGIFDVNSDSYAGYPIHHTESEE